MTHLPYIVASYGLTVGIVGWLAIGSWLRTRKARARLAQIDHRGQR